MNKHKDRANAYPAKNEMLQQQMLAIYSWWRYFRCQRRRYYSFSVTAHCSLLPHWHQRLKHAHTHTQGEDEVDPDTNSHNPAKPIQASFKWHFRLKFTERQIPKPTTKKTPQKNACPTRVRYSHSFTRSFLCQDSVHERIEQIRRPSLFQFSKNNEKNRASGSVRLAFGTIST